MGQQGTPGSDRKDPGGGRLSRRVDEHVRAGRNSAGDRGEAHPGGEQLPALERFANPAAGLRFSRPKRTAGGDSGSLFGSATDSQVASDAARDRDQLTGDRLTAQLNAPLTREGQLGKHKASKSQKQSALLRDNSDAQGSFFLGSELGAMQPFVTHF